MMEKVGRLVASSIMRRQSRAVKRETALLICPVAHVCAAASPYGAQSAWSGDETGVLFVQAGRHIAEYRYQQLSLVSVHGNTAGLQHCRLDCQVMCRRIVRFFFTAEDFGQVTKVAIVSTPQWLERDFHLRTSLVVALILFQSQQ